ncbi:MAG: hypothetical protein ACREO9_11265, partial [Lysobacterales bacterium]
ESQLLRLDTLFGQALTAVKRFGLLLDVYAGDGTHWTFDRWRALRFWRRAGTHLQNRGEPARP